MDSIKTTKLDKTTMIILVKGKRWMKEVLELQGLKHPSLEEDVTRE
jgi:hypothetical protein